MRLEDLYNSLPESMRETLRKQEQDKIKFLCMLEDTSNWLQQLIKDNPECFGLERKE